MAFLTQKQNIFSIELKISHFFAYRVVWLLNGSFNDFALSLLTASQSIAAVS
jgi:hypothetical protein